MADLPFTILGGAGPTQKTRQAQPAGQGNGMLEGMLSNLFAPATARNAVSARMLENAFSTGRDNITPTSGLGQAFETRQLMMAREQEMEQQAKQQEQVEQQRNLTRDLFSQEAPDLLPWIDAGQTDLAWSEYKRRKTPNTDDNLKSVGGHLYNSATGEWISPPGGDPELIKVGAGDTLFDPVTRQTVFEGAPDQKDAFGYEKDLFSQYSSSAPLKVYEGVRDGYERVRESARLGEQQQAQGRGSGAADISLVFAYMKALDPTSVVREGEYATAANAGGIPERVLNMYNALIRGDQLTSQVRYQFVEAADQLYRQAASNLGALNEQFTARANAYRVDPTRVIRQPETYEPLFGNSDADLDALIEKYLQ